MENIAKNKAYFHLPGLFEFYVREDFNSDEELSVYEKAVEYHRSPNEFITM